VMCVAVVSASASASASAVGVTLTLFAALTTATLSAIVDFQLFDFFSH
jgi:hypothetical protein